MHFINIAILLAFASSSVLAVPTTRSPFSTTVEKRASARSFANLSISNGTAGQAEAEALAIFPTPSDLASVSATDLKTLQTERETVENAETTGFDPAIKAASDNTTKTALQNGKIKNKVLKLTTEVLALKIQQAQGKNVTEKIAQEQKKLTTNINLDKKAVGQTSRTVNFSGN